MTSTQSPCLLITGVFNLKFKNAVVGLNLVYVMCFSIPL